MKERALRRIRTPTNNSSCPSSYLPPRCAPYGECPIYASVAYASWVAVPSVGLQLVEQHAASSHASPG